MNDTEKRDPTSGELTKLYEVATVQLPNVIELYNKTAGAAEKLAGTDEKAFSRPTPTAAAHDGSSASGDTEMESMPGGAYDAWVEARDQFQYLMAQVAANLATAANGFIEAYNQFSGTDEENAYDIEKDIEWPEGHEDPGYEQPTWEPVKEPKD